MFSLGRILSMVLLFYMLGTWMVFTIGFGITFTEAERMVHFMDNRSNNSAASTHIMPLFIPQFVAVLVFPVTALSALADLYLSQTEESRTLWHCTTTLTSIGSIVYIMSAGSTFFITTAGTGALLILNNFVNSTSTKIGAKFLKSYLKYYDYTAYNKLLLEGNITAMVGILATTLGYIIHMCYWPHTLKPRNNRYIMSVDLLNVSMGAEAESD